MRQKQNNKLIEDRHKRLRTLSGRRWLSDYNWSIQIHNYIETWVLSSQVLGGKWSRWAKLNHLPPREYWVFHWCSGLLLQKHHTDIFTRLLLVSWEERGLGGGQNKPTPCPAEKERCDSGRRAAAVLCAKMAARSAYRHKAQLRGGRLPPPTMCLKCASSSGRFNSLRVWS